MTTSSIPPAAPKVYRTDDGLTYTKNGLMVLSLWLLWGDFAFNFFESIFYKFMPIFLKDLKASNTLIGVMIGSFSGLVNVLFLPGISRWCDNLRTPIGRRIPLLYLSTPLTVAAVIAVGYSPEIGGWLYEWLGAHLPGTVTKGGMILGLLCVLTAGFHFFNMLLYNGYNWLIRDVVPMEVMSRFLAWFSIVSTLSGMLFMWFAFPHLTAHRGPIFLGVGIFYLLAFLLMCRKVKEGHYPPPVPKERRTGVFETFAVYFSECLRVPLYRNFIIVFLLMVAAGACGANFITLFAKETLGLDMAGIGHISVWASLCSLLFFYPLGWLCDRFSPLYVALAAIAGCFIGAITAAVFVRSQTGFMVYSIANALPVVAWALSQRATAMRLFPIEKFGQFSGALNVFGCGAQVIGNILLGVLMDWSHSSYRMAFLWVGVISICAFFPMVLVIRGWKKHGGLDHYIAPLPDRPRSI